MLGLGLRLAAPPARRASRTWTPAELGAKLLAWWDATDASTFSLSSGLVNSWTDKKNGIALTSAISGEKPTFVADGMNSGPAVRFDGADDRLRADGNYNSIFPTASQEGEMWALVDQTAPGADASSRFATSYSGSAGAATNRRRINRSIGNRFQMCVGNGGGEAIVTNTTVNFSGVKVARGLYVDGALRADVGGAPSPLSPTVPSSSAERVSIGANNANTAGGFWQGGVSQVIYTQKLTDAETASMYAYLNQLGGL